MQWMRRVLYCCFSLTALSMLSANDYRDTKTITLNPSLIKPQAKIGIVLVFQGGASEIPSEAISKFDVPLQAAFQEQLTSNGFSPVVLMSSQILESTGKSRLQEKPLDLPMIVGTAKKSAVDYIFIVYTHFSSFSGGQGIYSKVLRMDQPYQRIFAQPEIRDINGTVLGRGDKGCIGYSGCSGLEVACEARFLHERGSQMYYVLLKPSEVAGSAAANTYLNLFSPKTNKKKYFGEQLRDCSP